MIRIDGLSKTFDAGTSREVMALSGVNIEIARGDLVIVMGPNGSGKSTLLNCITGQVPADAGTVIINERDVTTLSEHRRSRMIGRVFQDPSQGTAGDLSILDNMRLSSVRTKTKGLVIGTGKEFREVAAKSLSTLGLGLEQRLHTRVNTLSGGQRQSLTLLMAVADECDVLLMDEPTAALDPKTAIGLMQMTERIARQKQLTTMLITHNINDAVNFGNRFMMMKEGRVFVDHHKESMGPLTVEMVAGWFSS